MDILLVEDERTLAVPLAQALVEAGHHVVSLADGAVALAWLGEHRCDLVVTDVRLPGANGLAILQRTRQLDPPGEVLVMTGYASVDQAVEAMRGGAVSYLQKPFPMDAMLRQVERVAEAKAMQAELKKLRAQHADDPTRLTGHSPAIQEINQRLHQVATQEVPVLIVGESGTGKERVARALHQLRTAGEHPFVPVSCSAIPSGLVEGELFGFVRGAFTGAEEDRQGLFAEAGHGTLFLDDVDDVPLEAQAKLLRVLQEREYSPLGHSQSFPVQARILAASKIPLEKAVAAGTFREDLFFRLNVVPLRLPPLRERPEDIGALLGALLSRWDPEGRYRVGDEALRKLMLHPWPGNVRELENALRRALALSGRSRILRYEHFSLSDGQELPPGATVGLKEAVAKAERAAIRAALAATEGKKLKAAELLGVSRKVLWQKMKELGLQEEKTS